MANRVHRMVHSMQPPGGYSIVSGLPVNPKAFELFERNQPMLPIGNLGDLPVPSAPTPPPMGR